MKYLIISFCKVIANYIENILKDELKKYPYIPKEMYDDIFHALKRGEPKYLVPLVSDKTRRTKFFKSTNNLFKKASEITELSPIDLFIRTDFHSNDISRSRIESAFAELRTIIFLYNMHFSDITPLKAKRNRKCSDFTAIKECHKYAIEVFCKISKELKKEFNTNEITLEPLTYFDDLLQSYVSKAQDKKEQIDDAAKEMQCDKKILVMVVNDKNILGFLTFDEHHDGDYKILEKISSELKWGYSYHFAIVTGLVSIIGGNKYDGDIIFPPIE